MDGVISSAQVSSELRNIVDERFNNPSRVWGIPWSGSFGDFPTLDGMTGGIVNVMHVLVSRPGFGKSAAAGQFAGNGAENIKASSKYSGRRVVVFTSEMAPSSYYRRMGCALSGVNNNDVKDGFVNYSNEMQRRNARDTFYDAIEFIEKLPLVFKPGRVSVDDIVRTVIGDGSSNNPETAFWILDHIGLVTDGFDSYNRRALDQVSTRLQNLSQNCCGGLILGHINRGNQDKADKEPTLETVAGSDQICRDADWLFAIHRYDKGGTKQPQEEQNKAVVYGKIKVLKSRDGAEDDIHMRYNRPRTHWAESKELNRR